jgi:hypothetical protein
LRGAFRFVNAGGGCGGCVDFDLLPEELSFISLIWIYFGECRLFRLVVRSP